MKKTLSNLIIDKVCSATTMYTEANTRTRRLNRPRWAIVLKYEGETTYYCNGKRYVSNAENMVILPKSCSYDWLCSKAGHYAIIEFESTLSHDDIYPFPIKNHENILKIFKNLEYKRLIKKPMYEIESIRDTYTIILKLLDSLHREYIPSQKLQKLSPAVKYISQNYDKKLRNDTIAELTGVSTVYLRKLFTEVYGMSPLAYARELRIKKAKEMLCSDHGSISDIAVSLGYSNIYDFSRDFKKHTGVSPAGYTMENTTP